MYCTSFLQRSVFFVVELMPVSLDHDVWTFFRVTHSSQNTPYKAHEAAYYTQMDDIVPNSQFIRVHFT